MCKELNPEAREKLDKYLAKRERKFTIIVIVGFIASSGIAYWAYTTLLSQVKRTAEDAAIQQVKDSSDVVQAMEKQVVMAVSVIYGKFADAMGEIGKYRSLLEQIDKSNTALLVQQEEVEARQDIIQDRQGAVEVKQDRIQKRLADQLAQTEADIVKLTEKIQALVIQATGLSGEEATERLRMLSALTDSLQEGGPVQQLVVLRKDLNLVLERTKELHKIKEDIDIAIEQSENALELGNRTATWLNAFYLATKQTNSSGVYSQGIGYSRKPQVYGPGQRGSLDAGQRGSLDAGQGSSVGIGQEWRNLLARPPQPRPSR